MYPLVSLSFSFPIHKMVLMIAISCETLHRFFLEDPICRDGQYIEAFRDTNDVESLSSE